MISCVQILNNIFNKRKIRINVDGIISRVIPPLQYKIQNLKLCSLIMIGFIVFIIKKYEYYPVTVIGKFVYSKVISSSLKIYNIPHILCKYTNRVSYYETTDGEYIPFEGVNSNFFNDETVPIIPNTEKDLLLIESHIGIKNLNVIQDKILSKFNNINGINMATMKQMIGAQPDEGYVLFIKHFFGKLYMVKTTTKCWITELIITDNTFHLQPGNILTQLHNTSVENVNADQTIEIVNDECVVNMSNSQIILKRKHSYHVENNFSITSFADNDQSSLIYGLQHPRQIKSGNVYIVHPFHIPLTWDPFLTIMIVTIAIVKYSLN